MPKIRLFFNELLEEKKELEISGDDFHYLINVMRCDIGSEIFIFNERDGEFKTKISKKDKKKLCLEVIEKKEFKNISNYFELVFCPPKSQRLDILIQKCTEIGVKNFQPVISDHTVNRKININRLRKVIKESVEQSNQIKVPEIKEPISFNQFILKNEKVFFADIQSEINFSDLSLEKNVNGSILIGPEGDFSSKEIEALRENNNCTSFSLGHRILRSETAAIASLVLFNYFKN